MRLTFTLLAVAALLVIVVLRASAALAQTSDQARYPFAVVVSGPATAPPMMLIPGLMSSGDVWSDIVTAHGTTHRLHVVTLPGFAGQPALGPGPVLSRVRDALIGYIHDQRMIRPILVGHSVGGFLALSMAAAAPDLFGAVVSVDGLPFLPAVYDPAATPERTKPMAEQMMATYRSVTPERLKEQARTSLAAMITAPADVERAAEWAGRSDPDTVGRVAFEMYTTDLRSELTTIRAPVLLVGAGGGVPEAMLPALTAAYRAQVANVPRAAVVIATRARHFIMLDDPAFLGTVMDRFLGEHALEGNGR